MINRLLVVVLFATLAVLPSIQSCDKPTAPEPEFLASFTVSVPDTVTPGTPFPLTVTAVGSQGTSPYSSFAGPVILTASEGKVTPDTLVLTDGAGSGEVVLSGGSDAHTITATHGGVEGSAVVNARLMGALQGDPDDSANEAIPGFEFYADGHDYSDNHPALPGMYVSHNTIMLAFELGTTVSEANSILSSVDARIVGGIPGAEGIAPGVLFLKLSTSGHTDLQAVLNTLEADSHVNTAVQDVLMGTDEIPAPNDGDPPTWTWERTPGGANWGLERIRVPQMWSFNQAVAKKLAAEQRSPSTVFIVDLGFVPWHEDLPPLYYEPAITAPHGTHVAGIIGATYNNGKGIDGICPYVSMFGYAVAANGGKGTYMDKESAGQAIINGLYWGVNPMVDVVNMSVGYNWARAGIDSDTDELAQSVVTRQAQILANTLQLGRLSFSPPLIVVSAGNDSEYGFGDQSARYNSPMCYAAIAMGVENIVVVEAVMDDPGTVAGGVTHWPGSSIGGHVSAPGFSVWGTTSETSRYRGRDGTSEAAAIVSGIAAYLYTIEPNLTFQDVKDVLLSTALAAGGGAKPRVDAWSSLIDLDRVRGGDNFLRVMCDIDDGTPDGNQRVTYDGKEFLDNDADMDQGVGDGDVDMSDFRCWRDWFLLQQTTVDIDIDGDRDHPKKDVNNNGTVEDPTLESIFPRGDFNGDGILDETTKSYVPGAVGAEVTDLEVLQSVFSDPDYDSSELPGLLYSADYQIDASFLFESSTEVYAQLWLPSGGVAAVHTFTPEKPLYVFTMPADRTSYEVEVVADGESFAHGDRAFTLAAGGDAIFKPLVYVPLNPAATYLHTCQDTSDANDPAPPATAISLAEYGVKPGDVICLDNEGFFAFTSEDPDWTSEDQVAVFSSSAVITPRSDTHRVPGAIDAGEDFVTEPTYGCDGELTDIPEDFAVIGDGTIIRVPDGAKYLFVCARDILYVDNWAPSGRFGVQISIVKVPGE